MTVILVNCVTLGMYSPCADTTHCDRKCLVLKVGEADLHHLVRDNIFLYRLPIT